MEQTSSSPEETEEIAGRIAASLRPGDVVAVSGELGAGKTTFIRGAAHALGVETAVTSPTYTIGNRYDGHIPVSHLDLYRFESVSAPEWGDLEPYFVGAVCFVEWPEAAGSQLPPVRMQVRLRHIDESHRAISIDDADPGL
jgi:tRNA threonylcarbamoyladenosine biosynthesis protein TsaE